MKKLKKVLAVLAVSVGITLGMAMPAQAACWYQAPQTGYINGWFVHYYNCTGPYWGSDYPPYYRYNCHADFDWRAEWFGGEVDRNVWVWGQRYCSA